VELNFWKKGRVSKALGRVLKWFRRRDRVEGSEVWETTQSAERDGFLRGRWVKLWADGAKTGLVIFPVEKGLGGGRRNAGHGEGIAC